MIGLFCALAALLLFPHDAFAWGSGVHLQLGSTVLENLPALRPAVAAVIGAYPFDFLYGCIAADITIGKKFTHYLLHCHRWQMGLKVLENAETDAQRACAYGYLSHLAADTIAHNYYVPYKLMMSFSTLTLKHAYWEMRFETFVDREIWEIGKKVAKEHFRENDALLSRVLSDTIFSFGTNKRIFNSILLLSRLEKWQQVSRSLTGASRYALDGKRPGRVHEPDPGRGLRLPVGPGRFPLLPGRSHRGTGPGRRRGGSEELPDPLPDPQDHQEQAMEQLEEMKPRLRDAIWEPHKLLEILSAEDKHPVAIRPARNKRGSILI